MQPGAWRGARLSHEGDEPPFIGGRQVDGDAVDRERDSRIADGRAHTGRGSRAPSSQGSRPYSRSGQHHRFGYLLEVPGVGRS